MDAAIIAVAARTLPHTLRSIMLADEKTAELSMMCGFDDDLAKQATATSNRIRGLLTKIHPALERVIGTHLDHPAMAELLIKYPTPDKLRKAVQARVATLLSRYAPRAGKGWAAEVFTALGEQSVVVASTHAAGTGLPQLDAILKQLRTASTLSCLIFYGNGAVLDHAGFRLSPAGKWDGPWEERNHVR